MKAPADTKTADLLPAHDLAGERPAKPTQAEKAAARLAKMREQKRLLAFTVNIDAALKLEFDAWLAAHPEKTRNGVIAHVLRTQILRKR